MASNKDSKGKKDHVEAISFFWESLVPRVESMRICRIARTHIFSQGQNRPDFKVCATQNRKYFRKVLLVYVGDLSQLASYSQIT